MKRFPLLGNRVPTSPFPVLPRRSGKSGEKQLAADRPWITRFPSSMSCGQLPERHVWILRGRMDRKPRTSEARGTADTGHQQRFRPEEGHKGPHDSGQQTNLALLRLSMKVLHGGSPTQNGAGLSLTPRSPGRTRIPGQLGGYHSRILPRLCAKPGQVHDEGSKRRTLGLSLSMGYVSHQRSISL